MYENAERQILSFQTAAQKAITLELLAIYPCEGCEYGVCREVDREGNYLPPDEVVFQIVRANRRNDTYEFSAIQSDLELSAASEGLDRLIDEGRIVLPQFEHEEGIIELPDPDGNIRKYQLLTVVEYNCKHYAAIILLDSFSDATSPELLIELREYALAEQDGVQGAVFSTIDSDAEYETVQALIERQIFAN